MEKYTALFVTNDYLDYEFTSTGPKGNIIKIVQFRNTQNPGIVNLAFGNKLEDGGIDDLARDDNKDRNKILVTLASILEIFFSEYPDKWVFFTGSTPERTRLYRMAITLYYNMLKTDFIIHGVYGEMNGYADVPFEKGITYIGFLIKKKNV